MGWVIDGCGAGWRGCGLRNEQEVEDNSNIHKVIYSK